jgi:predicted CopG family antitoxin
LAKTTIQVDEDIVEMLEHLKREKAVKSYSEALRQVLNENKTLRKSERGTLPKLKPFSREKFDRFD